MNSKSEISEVVEGHDEPELLSSSSSDAKKVSSE